MAFWGDGGLPLPGVYDVVGGGGHEGDSVGGGDGVVAQGAKVHLELGPLLSATCLPFGAHLIMPQLVL